MLNYYLQHRVLDGEEYEGRTANNRKIRRFKMADSNVENTLYKASHINRECSMGETEFSTLSMVVSSVHVVVC